LAEGFTKTETGQNELDRKCVILWRVGESPQKGSSKTLGKVEKRLNRGPPRWKRRPPKDAEKGGLREGLTETYSGTYTNVRLEGRRSLKKGGRRSKPGKKDSSEQELGGAFMNGKGSLRLEERFST